MSDNLLIDISFEKQVKLGAYYTNDIYVNIVMSLIKPYLNEKSILLDSSAGCGAFIKHIDKLDNKSIAIDIDKNAINFLKQNYFNTKIYNKNALFNVSRNNFGIKDNDFLITIGNPPYNDTTSKSKNKLKESPSYEIDNDLKSRDLGISFLKSYNKLNADVICVLHPLSYLIKESNFKQLKEFKDNYKLKKAILISSKDFYRISKTEFPIAIALYEKTDFFSIGMSFEYIKNFEFEIYNSNKKLILSKIQTIDGYIRKYPPSKNENPKSDINLYFYPLRDINALMSSATFIEKENFNNYITVNLKDFHKYAYLNVFKYFFKNEFYLGNLSPIIDINRLENDIEFKNNCISWAVLNNPKIELFKDKSFLDNFNINYDIEYLTKYFHYHHL